MIEFVEKEPWHDDSPFTGSCDMYPVFMVKNGKEFFVINRRVPGNSWAADDLERIKRQLIETDGAYTRFNGMYQNPLKMLEEIVERKHSFREPDSLFVETQSGYFVDFHGNRKEVSAAYHYRIYDLSLVEKIRSITEHINRKEWEEAKYEIHLFKTREN